MMMPMLQSTPEPTTRQSAPSFRCWRRARCRRAAVLCCSCSWARAYWQVAGGALLHHADVVERAQTERIGLEVGCCLKQRPTPSLRPCPAFYETPLAPELRNTLACHNAGTYS